MGREKKDIWCIMAHPMGDSKCVGLELFLGHSRYIAMFILHVTVATSRVSEEFTAVVWACKWLQILAG
jgi:hypothetical protein